MTQTGQVVSWPPFLGFFTRIITGNDMKKEYKELSDYHTDPKDPALPFFQRFIPAFLVMERWGMDYRVFRNHPLCRHRSFVATREYDDTVNNPYLLDHPGRKDPFKGLIWPPKDIPPFEKEDFERVVYDFYTIAQYEYHHPEIVKRHDVSEQLEEEFLKNYPVLEPKSPANTLTLETVNLKWAGITATFLNESEILFQYSGESMEKNYKQFGLEDGRSGNPREAWTYFLEASRSNGQICYSMENRSAVEKHVELIRKKLRELFPGVARDPLPHKSGYYEFEIHLKNNITD